MRTLRCRAAVRNRCSRRGVVSAELALVFPVLLVLFLGICEIGLILADSLALGNACREAARAASLGRTTDEIRAVAAASVPDSLVLRAENVSLERRRLTGGVWGEWLDLGDTVTSGSNYNDALTGDQIRVTLTYSHPLISGELLQAARQDGTIRLRTSLVMLRY